MLLDTELAILEVLVLSVYTGLETPLLLVKVISFVLDSGDWDNGSDYFYVDRKYFESQGILYEKKKKSL